MTEHTADLRRPKHAFVARLIKCECGKVVAAEKFERHLLDASKDEALDGVRRALRQAAR